MKYSAVHQVLRLIAAVILGEVILVLGTTFVQEVLLGGIGWYSSGILELLAGGVGSFIIAIISGIVAYIVVDQVKTGPILILSMLVIVETVWLISNKMTDGPTWFDLLGGATLILGFWVGRWIMSRRSVSKETIE